MTEPTPAQPKPGLKPQHLIPLGVFIVLVIFLAIGLKLDPKEVPSPLIDKPAPAFSLPQLKHPDQPIGVADMKGKVWILNVWASWCVSCRAEHEVVKGLAKLKLVDVIGLNYKDDPEDAQRWLKQYGDPYLTSAVDADGRVGIDWGVYGVPESFVVDQQGIIRYKQIGPITEEALQQTIIPLIKKLKGEA